MADDNAYWLAALALVADELQRLTPAEFDARRDKLVAVLRNAVHRLSPLTDADVDAFLAAVDETDPERVERIRKLFRQKLEE